MYKRSIYGIIAFALLSTLTTKVKYNEINRWILKFIRIWFFTGSEQIVKFSLSIT